MSITIHEVSSVSAATKTAISRKSAQTLPNNPSERGYSAEEIKRRFYQPVLDAANSAIAEIDRVVGEVNTAFGDVKDEIDNFIDGTKIKEAYKLTLSNETWEYNDETNLYEVVIPQSTHKIDDYKEIGVDMFLLDGSGIYTHVNQFEVKSNGDVRCFHETNGAGYVSIYVKREGFIVGTAITDIDHVIGAARVARTNSYNDLNDQPNLDGISENADMISKIISGIQNVGKADFATNSRNATYAETAGTATSAISANAATRATQDQYGVNISDSYAKKNGNYQTMTVGNATSAGKATNDANGANIANTYAKQNGTYANMSVGNATNATNATNAKNAEKATNDSNGSKITDTYATKTGNYPNMTVGNATKATTATTVNGSITSNTTAATQSAGTNNTTVANTAFVNNALAAFISTGTSDITHYISNSYYTNLNSVSSWVNLESDITFKRKTTVLNNFIIYSGFIHNPSNKGDDYWYKLVLPSSLSSSKKIVSAIPYHNNAYGQGGVLTTYTSDNNVYICRDRMNNGGSEDRADIHYLIFVYLK